MKQKNKFSNVNSEEKACYSIGNITEFYGLSPWTIRMWANRFDQLEYFVDSDGGMWFSPRAVEQIGEICRLIKKKMTLEDVRKHLK